MTSVFLICALVGNFTTCAKKPPQPITRPKSPRMENAVLLCKGELAPSNTSMVEKARHLLDELGAHLMTPKQVRTMMGLRL